MSVLLVGSTGGLHRVEDGHTDLEGKPITAVEGRWAVVDAQAVWDGTGIEE